MANGIVLLGAGGHAKVVIEILRASGRDVSYCVGGSDAADECLGVPVLKGDHWLLPLRSEGYTRAFIGIGANRLRLKLANIAQSYGYELINAISPSAVVSPSVKIGIGVVAMAGAIINAEAEISDLAIINTGATVDHDCKIGRAVHIAPQSGLAGNVSVGEGAFLGIGCRVIPGVTIGEWSTVGAGAVVTINIPANVTAVGVPAKFLIK
jgi:UDP-perosamine 4-acetyltransferase